MNTEISKRPKLNGKIVNYFPELSQQLVKEYFDYKDGFLYFKYCPHPKVAHLVYPGKKAGCLANGSYSVGMHGKSYSVSIIVFLWHNGYIPENVDHRDRDRTNNRIENLRDSDYLTNSQNRCNHKNSLSKFKGVSLTYKGGEKPYRARIMLKGKSTLLGWFKTEIEAAKAYDLKAAELFGEFAYLNFPSNAS